jgi:hypothetical protein
MDKPWFKLDPNNLRDRWWLYTSITDTKKAFIDKNNMNIQCYFIIQDHNMGNNFYRISVWFKDNPNRYACVKHDYDWLFDKKLNEMNEGDIVNIYSCKFKVYNCRFVSPLQIDMCKILEIIEE